MAELADALDLESNGQPCRFDSCYPHQKMQGFDLAFFMSNLLKFDYNVAQQL